MRELTAEGKEFLVNYCMEPENTRLALEIGQIYPKLREKIVSSFLKELDKSVKKGLEERDCQWQTCTPKMNPAEGEEPSIYVMTMKDPEIEIHLIREKSDLFVGTPAANEACPQAEDLASFFEDTDLALKSHDSWRWYFYPGLSHKSFEALNTLHDDELRRDKIAYFTDMLVRPAKAISAISKVLGA